MVEIVSPDDETYAKLSSYAEHRVNEVLTLEPTARLVGWLGLVGSDYHDINVSGLIPLGVESLVQASSVRRSTDGGDCLHDRAHMWRFGGRWTGAATLISPCRLWRDRA